MAEQVDAIIVGTGFASSFFLYRLLSGLDDSARVVVLEAGRRHAHAWQLSHPRALEKIAADSFINRTPEKPWIVQRAFGGGSNCWWACTPRLLPNDFRLRSSYGVAVDWPIDYEQLEPFYGEAEWLMDVAGPSDDTPFPAHMTGRRLQHEHAHGAESADNDPLLDRPRLVAESADA